VRIRKVEGPTGDLLKIIAGTSEIDELLVELPAPQSQKVRTMCAQFQQAIDGPCEVKKPRAPKE
jgi:hypothetical protein